MRIFLSVCEMTGLTGLPTSSSPKPFRSLWLHIPLCSPQPFSLAPFSPTLFQNECVKHQRLEPDRARQPLTQHALGGLGSCPHPLLLRKCFGPQQREVSVLFVWVLEFPLAHSLPSGPSSLPSLSLPSSLKLSLGFACQPQTGFSAILSSRASPQALLAHRGCSVVTKAFGDALEFRNM